MYCSTLKDLPPSPKGKIGWPWTEESLQLPDTMSDGKPWPKISIVTPNYNYGRFLEETIRSVLLQGYPNLEYIIIDGGSNDNSVEIIKKYEGWLSFWVSEKDRGQGHAINKGFMRAQGELFAWLNSDDTYEKDALFKVAKEFMVHPEADIISGRCRLWSGKPDDVIMEASPLRSYEDFLQVNSSWLNGERCILQPEAFFRRRAYELTGGIPENYPYAFDVALWIRMARSGCRFHSISEHLANLRIHKAQKTENIFASHTQVCGIAWDSLLRDWDMFGNEKVLSIAANIFEGMERVQGRCQEHYNEIKNSASYRIGHCLIGFLIDKIQLKLTTWYANKKRKLQK